MSLSHTARLRWFLANLVLSLLLLALPAPCVHAQPQPFDTPQPGTWHAVPSSAVRAVEYPWPADIDYGSIRGGGGYFSESGAAVDTIRQRLLIWGGGHGNYAGNEIYAFDMQTLQWTRLTDPCLHTDPQGKLEATGYYPDAQGQPDPQCPRSTHSYNALVYVPPIDSLCAMGLWAMFPTASVVSPMTICYSFATRQWERKADVPMPGQSRVVNAVYDPVNQLVWVVRGAGGYLAAWSPVTNRWTSRGPTESRWLDGTVLFDSKRQRVVFLGSGLFFYHEVSPSGARSARAVSPSGDTDILKDWRPGFVYDSTNDVYVVHSGELRDLNRDGKPGLDLAPEKVWVIHPDTWAIKALAPAATNTVIPKRQEAMPDGRSHTFGRFAYFPSLKAFVLVNSRATDPVYVYRLEPSALR